MPVLDTNFLIALRAGDEGADRLLEEMRHEVLLVPSIVAVEFLTPFGAKAAAAFEVLRGSFHVTDTNTDWVLTAAKLRERLQRQKKTIRLADFWIAAWAELAATYVVTRDTRHFEKMGISTRSW